jgi:signal transduction histidine kinase
MSSSPAAPDQAFVETIAAGLAHEVRNPLNALLINLRILEQEIAAALPDRTAHAYAVLRSIAAEIGHLDHFVGEFLRYARSQELRLDAVDVRALLGDLAAFVEPECARKGVALRVDAPAAPPPLQADAVQLKHALLNLVLNALAASRAGGTITLAAAADGATLRLEVRDTGEGIPPERLARAFELFFTTREGGTGLGLPISRRIAEAHGGTLALASEPGRGTTATMTLPLGGARV